MKSIFVKDLKKNDILSEENFVMRSIKKNTTKAGDTYLRIELADKTGIIAGNIWNNKIENCEEDALQEGKVVKVWAKIEEFKGQLQVNVTSVGISGDYDESDFIATSDRDIDEMWNEFNQHIDSIPNDDVKNLISTVIKDKEIANRVKFHPAAEKLHHAFRGGMIHHMLEMYDIADIVLSYYPEANISLVKAGIFFHDLGKIFEIDDNITSYTRSLKGNLLGHIAMSYEILVKFAPDNFPDEILTQIKHIVLSHHGLLEYGSPVMPMTIEANIVHQIDNLSSKTRQYQRILSENEGSEEQFSGRDFAIGTKVFLK